MKISKSIKQYLYLLSTLISIPMAHAGTMGDVEESVLTQNGFYLAGSLGIINLQARESHSYQPEAHQLSATGILGGGYGGYDFGIHQNFRLALEGFIDAVGVTTGLTKPSGSVNMSQSYQAGGRILPEYVFSQNLVGHWILGYANGRFNSQDNGAYAIYNTHFNLNGFQTGLGFTSMIKNNFLIRLDAFYNIYSGQSFIPDSVPQNEIKNGFGNLIGEMSMIYKFA